LPHKEIIEDICNGDCKEPYCTLKEVVLHSGITDRVLEQLKCVEILKWQLSYQQRQDVGWKNAWAIWLEKYAARFGDVYQDGMKSKELYQIVVGDKRD
jgi:hypothetical protein